MSTADLSSSTTMDLSSYIETKPSILIGDSLYFTLELGNAILKYDLVGQSLSVIDAPGVHDQMGIVMVAEDGGLGFAAIEGNNLHIWSWLAGDGNSVGWTPRRVIQLQSLFPVHNPPIQSELIGFAEGTDTLFLETEVGVFTLEIMSGKTRKVCETDGHYTVLPYMRFCAPVNSMTME
ncbi:hypothetical protein PVAP13_2KG081716 [Panicum virgatum]|uniref:F-box protein AT5G49610-like beta-propeller domain-containing protein n=1 Tax=Panicum virgatum TaxID=38727 RepID=A0A8T0WAM2_PANVG|nr:hypothetical protein PVAP13_2KG081716 [Panicum virgatum]